MKKILITGGAGFIGSNFINNVFKTDLNWKIINLDILTYAGNPANLDNLAHRFLDKYEFVHGDIRDRPLLEKLFFEKKIDGVIHFAAESHVDRSIDSPHEFVKTNVEGTVSLIDVCTKYYKSFKKSSEFRFLHVSTDEVYGSLGTHGYFTENTPYDPSSPYSASKAASDHFVRAYFRTYGLPVVITNCSNNYGPYQFPEKLIPLIILNIMEQKTLPVYGDGKNIRDWLYVTDHCNALIKVFKKGVPGETYNIGGNSEQKNIEIVNLICKIMDRLEGRKHGSSQKLIKFVADRPGHDRRYAIDSTKIKTELGWKPEYEFEDALEKTVIWYLENKKWVKSVKTGTYLEWIKKNYNR